MTKLKRIIALGAMVLTIGATSVSVFAASNYSTPAEALAALTGRTVESITAEKSKTEKTYGKMANEAGKLTEFKAEILEIKKDALAKKVANGTITKEKATEIITVLESNQANCDGTVTAKIGRKLGSGFGSLYGNEQGKAHSRGGAGNRQGLCNSYCLSK